LAAWESIKGRVPMKVTYTDFRCKYCNSENIIKYGKFRGIQRYFCNDCKRKFADNDALPNMKTSTDQVGAALNMYYEGMSLNAIRRQLDQTHRNYPSDSTVYEWIERFSKEAISEAKKYTPNVGDVWVADETVLKIDGKNIWFWDIIDAKTRFLLASHVSANRGTREAKALMEKAQARAGKTPKVVLTDKLAAYIDGIEQAFGADAKHIQSKPFTVKDSTNLIERFHGTLKARTKVMRGLKEIETARLFTDGWLVHYNFFRAHETLGKPPAEEAGIRFTFKNWLGVVNQPRIIVREVKLEELLQPKRHKAYSPQVRISSMPSRISTPKPRRPKQYMGVSWREGGQYVSTGIGGGRLLSRRPLRGMRVLRRKPTQATLSRLRF